MNRTMRLTILILIAILLTACQSANETNPHKNRPTPPQPSAGNAVMTGQVMMKSDGKPIPVETPVRLAQIYRQGSEGAFVLDLAHSPSSLSIAEGYFTLVDISPAEYLIVVGKPEDGNYVIFSGANGKPITYQIAAGKTIDIGVITVDYKP